jgi:N utilization substance protein B
LKKSTNPQDSELNLDPIDAELDLHQDNVVPDEDFGPWQPEFSLATRRDERQLAFCLLYALDRAEYSIPLEDVEQSFEKGFDFKIPQGSFAVKLVRGVVDHMQQLDDQLKPYLKNWRLERLGCCTHLVLRLALWELQQKGAIASIVINEAVELAKTFAEKDAYRFVNGILDEIAKKNAETNESEQPKSKESK